VSEAPRHPGAPLDHTEQLIKARVLEALFDEVPAAPRIGRFQILARLGAGAMGEVFAAYDEQLDRKVAVKLLRPEERTAAAEERLLGEAQALARLSHPNVVQVYEVGRLADRVFIAMEFIDGAPLHQWARGEASWRAQLQALLQAGRGLAAAHAAGLVHRDVKPANLVVGRGGRVTVIDFGLAQAHAPGQGPGPGLAGTPAYMAPEVPTTGATPKSDQFSFAVTAYELLTGARPFPDDALPVFTRRAPAPGPRASPAPAWVMQALLTALAEAPDARFPELEALLAALGRDPAARRRRRWGAAALVSGGLALGALGLGGYQRAVADPCAGGPAVWTPALGAELEAQALGTGLPFAQAAWRRASGLLARYSQGLSAAHRAACEATHVAHAQSEALLDRRMACIEHRRRVATAAVAVLRAAPEAALARADQIMAGLPDVGLCANPQILASGLPPPPSRAAAAAIDAARDHLARAEAHQAIADLDPAAAALAAAEAQLAGVEDGPAEAELARVRGVQHLLRGEWRAGIDDLKAAVRGATIHRHDELVLDAWLSLLALTARDLGRPEVAAEWVEQASTAFERLAEPKDPRGLVLARARALVASAAGDYRGAAALLSAAIERADPERPETWDLRHDLAAARATLGEAEAARRNYEALLPRYVEAWGPEHPKTGVVLAALGLLQIEGLGRLDQGEENLTRAQEIFRAALGEDALRVAETSEALSQLAMYRGDSAGALARAERAHAILRARLGPEHPRVARALMNTGALRHLQGDYPGAVAAYRAALPSLEVHLGPEHDDLGTLLSNLGESLVALGRPDEARPALERGLKILRARLGPQHPDLAYPLKGLGLAALAADRPQAALTYLEDALRLTPPQGADPRERAEIGWGLARALRRAGRSPERARGLAEEARRVYRSLGADGVQQVRDIDGWMGRGGR
jgi:tetratricopeptide (TPR) repeat protein/predicted Ser/Thr protein kinase